MNGSPFAGVSLAGGGGGGGATVVSLPVLPWICDCTGMLRASVVEGAELAMDSLAAADVVRASLAAADDGRVSLVAADDAAGSLATAAEDVKALLDNAADSATSDATAEETAAAVLEEARVCNVLAGGGAIEPSWKDGAGGAFIGNEPAGQIH